MVSSFMPNQIYPHITAKCLLEHGIPFIIPGNQMYLPHLGIDLREHFRKFHDQKDRTFSPATQAVVIYALFSPTDGKLTSSLLAEKLGYTLMTINRAFAELKTSAVGEFLLEGRERRWSFSNKQALWEEARAFLTQPHQKTHLAKKASP